MAPGAQGIEEAGWSAGVAIGAELIDGRGVRHRGGSPVLLSGEREDAKEEDDVEAVEAVPFVYIEDSSFMYILII